MKDKVKLDKVKPSKFSSENSISSVKEVERDEICEWNLTYMEVNEGT